MADDTAGGAKGTGDGADGAELLEGLEQLLASGGGIELAQLGVGDLCGRATRRSVAALQKSSSSADSGLRPSITKPAALARA